MRKIAVATTLAIAIAASGFVSAQAATGPLPFTLRFCAFYCITYTLKGDHYEAPLPGTPPGTLTILKVERFGDGKIILHRTDALPNPATADLSGAISPAGNTVSSGEIAWTSDRRGKGTFKMAWGSALTTLAADGLSPETQAQLAKNPPRIVGSTTPPCFPVAERRTSELTALFSPRCSSSPYRCLYSSAAPAYRNPLSGRTL